MNLPYVTKKPQFIMFPIPYEVLEDAELGCEDLLEFDAVDGRIVIRRVDDDDLLIQDGQDGEDDNGDGDCCGCPCPCCCRKRGGMKDA